MITLIILLLLLIKSLGFIYIFQIKEYRSDRLFSTLKEEGWFKILYLHKPHWPAKTIRNLLITLIIIGITLIMIPLSVLTSNRLELLLIPFIPLISFCMTFVAVQLTGIVAHYQRQKIINTGRKMAYHSKAVCIGVTGSYGKSTVKEFLYTILKHKFKVAKTDKNMNTDVGIALSVIKNLKPDTQYFITEFGAYKRGEIEQETTILHPQYSILTGLGNQHLDLYGSLENLKDEETFILNILHKHNKAYINLDFPQSKEAIKKVKAKKVLYSIEKPANVEANNITQTTKGMTADITYKNQSFSITTSLLGKHNILNLLPAIALGMDLGMNSQEIIDAITQIKQLPGKLSLHNSMNGALALNDSYNTNENGFIAAIQTANDIQANDKYIVTKGIIELGVEKRASYERIINTLKETPIKLITTDKLFQELDTEERVIVLNDVKDIETYLQKHLNKGALVVLEGRFPKQFVTGVIGGIHMIELTTHDY